MNRRSFLRSLTVAGALPLVGAEPAGLREVRRGPDGPIVVSTWDFKLPANQTAARVLSDGGTGLDAVEQGIRVVESDPSVTSVGRGGFPDRDGHLTLDACIMDHRGNAGSVMFLEGIAHPISVARRVMEKTPHVILAGEGALRFALEQGFSREALLTENAAREYQKWLSESGYVPPVGEKNHDTIGLLVMDTSGDLAGGCSTSGAAWKMHGRVGDSPVIGAGLFVDNEIGAATSSGLGEAVIKVAGSALIVEQMRQGKTPQEACVVAIDRIFRKQPQYRSDPGFFVGFLALSKDGEIGALGSRSGFQYSLFKAGVHTVVDAPVF